MHRKRNAQSTGVWQRNALIALCSVLTVILVVLIIGTAFVHNMLNRLGRVEPGDVETMSPSQAEDLWYDDEYTDPTEEFGDSTGPSDPSAPSEPLPTIGQVVPPTQVITSYKHGEHVINIGLVGQDRRPGQGRQRSDTMILVTFNTSTNSITLTSFMRDMYVTIPGYQPNRINTAYMLGGFNLFNRTLETNFGVHVDGNVEVDFDGFVNVINLLGGVDIQLSKGEANYLIKYCGFDVHEGMNTLNGHEALEYSRIRKIDSDYQRTERQRKVLISLLNKYKTLPVPQMLSVMEQVLPMITTNMSNTEILTLAARVMPMLSSANINSLRIPVNGSFKSGVVQVRPGLKAWLQYDVDFAANHRILQQLFVHK